MQIECRACLFKNSLRLLFPWNASIIYIIDFKMVDVVRLSIHRMMVAFHFALQLQ